MCEGAVEDFSPLCVVGREGGGVWFEIKQPPNQIDAVVLPLDSWLLGTAI